MDNIDVNDVIDESLLDIINFKNLLLFENKTFFENMDNNLENIIFDVGLDKYTLENLVGLKMNNSLFFKKYEEKYNSGAIKRNKDILESAYNYMTMFLSSSLIIYDEKIVTIDGKIDTANVFHILFERFKNGKIYENLEGYYSFYQSKKQNSSLVKRM